MKRVLLLGDSIRLGYCEKVGELLKGKAEVCWPQENCRFALYAVVSMNNLAYEVGNADTVDVVHWNCGQWDVAQFGALGRPLMSVEEYSDALKRVHERIRQVFPNAKIIFALTTPLCDDIPLSAPRTTEDVIRYNEAARKVMDELNVPIDDLFEAAKEIPDELYADGVHYKPEGYQVLAEAVVRALENYI